MNFKKTQIDGERLQLVGWFSPEGRKEESENYRKPIHLHKPQTLCKLQVMSRLFLYLVV